MADLPGELADGGIGKIARDPVSRARTSRVASTLIVLHAVEESDVEDDTAVSFVASRRARLREQYRSARRRSTVGANQ